jgi:hypothetical protein
MKGYYITFRSVTYAQRGEAALRAAGVTGFVFAGGDALATLQDTYRRMEQP